VNDQLLAALEQVGQARRSVGSLEAVLLLHGHPWHPPALGCHCVSGASQLLLLDEQRLARGLPLLRRDDGRGLHCDMPSLDTCFIQSGFVCLRRHRGPERTHDSFRGLVTTSEERERKRLCMEAIVTERTLSRAQQ